VRRDTRPKRDGKGDDAVFIIEGTKYRVPNEDVCDQVNTIIKMAQKRALVAVTLLGTNASELFTQDVEDLYDELRGRGAAQGEPPPAGAGDLKRTPAGDADLSDKGTFLYELKRHAVAREIDPERAFAWLHKYLADRGTTLDKTGPANRGVILGWFREGRMDKGLKPQPPAADNDAPLAPPDDNGNGNGGAHVDEQPAPPDDGGQAAPMADDDSRGHAEDAVFVGGPDDLAAATGETINTETGEVTPAAAPEAVPPQAPAPAAKVDNATQPVGDERPPMKTWRQFEAACVAAGRAHLHEPADVVAALNRGNVAIKLAGKDDKAKAAQGWRAKMFDAVRANTLDYATGLVPEGAK
jgi:hypothetical protein